MRSRRFLLTALLALLVVGPVVAQKAAKLPKPGKAAEIVFVGNSYTYFHDLPAMVRALGAADQPARKLETIMLAPGGMTLEGHWQATDQPIPKDVIAARKADYVVFQEQSTRPFTDPKRMDEFAEQFSKLCKQSKSVPVWYMTWARQQDPERQDSISEQYQKVHKQCGGLLAPVGRAWQPLRAAHPDLDLHMPDKSHPSPKGTYLAACVLYATMFGGEVASFPNKLSQQDATGKVTVLIELSEPEGKLLRDAAIQALAQKGGKVALPANDGGQPAKAAKE
jgi:hypothetical protein